MRPPSGQAYGACAPFGGIGSATAGSGDGGLGHAGVRGAAPEGIGIGAIAWR